MFATLHGRVAETLKIIGVETSSMVRNRLVGVLILVVIASVMTAAGPIALKLIVDELTGQGRERANLVYLWGGLFVVSQYLTRAMGEIRMYLYAGAERRLCRTLSERVFAHLMRLPLKFHLDRHTGALHQILNSGLQGFQMVLHHVVLTFLPVMAEFVTVAVVLVKLMPPPLWLMYCGALVCYGLLFARSAAGLAQSAGVASASDVAAGAVITDGVLNYETVKCFTAEAVVLARVVEALTRSEEGWLVFHRRYARNGLCMGAVFAAFLAATNFYAVRAVQTGRMSAGDFVLINTYMLQCLRPVEAVGYATQALSQGWAMLGKLLDLFRHTPERGLPDRGARVVSGRPAGEIEFSAVTLAYRPGQEVLKSLSFRVPPGKTVAIVGSSGSGKSTTVRLLVRLIDPDAGEITLDGAPILELPLQRLRRLIAVVPQDTVLFNDTIAYNIGFGKVGSSAIEIERAARLAHLHDFILSMPEGYDTLVGERGIKLSGGERQRVSIARAIIKQPAVYVFDEATSSLDTQSERRILQNLREVSRFNTTIMIAHRLSTVVDADEILVLESGVATERGSHQALMRQKGRYAALWNAQHPGTPVTA